MTINRSSSPLRTVKVNEPSSCSAIRRGKSNFPTQYLIIPNDAVVSQGEQAIGYSSPERVVIVVSLLTSLGRQPRMAHNGPGICGDMEAHLMGRKGTFINTELAMTVVSDSRGICPSGLAGDG